MLTMAPATYTATIIIDLPLKTGWKASWQGAVTRAQVDQRLPDGKTSGICVAEVSMRLHELAEKEKPPGCLRG